MRNQQSAAVVEATVRHIGGFYLGERIESTREILDLEKEGFENVLEGDKDRALMLAGEVSGRIKDICII